MPTTTEIIPTEIWILLIWDADQETWILTGQHVSEHVIRGRANGYRRSLGRRCVRVLHTADGS